MTETDRARDEQAHEPRVIATGEATQAIADLVSERGPLLFVQSGGCCDGSLPMCFEASEFRVGDHDLLLGQVTGCPVYLDHRMEAIWRNSQMIIDVAAGEPEGFSLGATGGRHFVARSRVWGTDLAACELPTNAPQPANP